jgi:hypothetical protein
MSVLLAQASTARALKNLATPPVQVPVLASPQLALAEMRHLLGDGVRVPSEPDVMEVRQ